MDAAWYLRRLSRMEPREVGGRVVTLARARRWRDELTSPAPAAPAGGSRFTAVLPPGVLRATPEPARLAALAAADRLMAGRADHFGVSGFDRVAPEWSLDPWTGGRAPADAYAFDIAYRDEDAVGDIKQIWEPSRHQHLTVLAAAYALTGDEAYARRVSGHLRSWWAAHPPMRGAHWISGIELGIRLISWVWVRRLLAGWDGVTELFDDNPEALHQIRTHQRWLTAFPSHGSSANNHAVAESAGLLAAACAFPWFPESARWRATALGALEQHLCRNTFDSGLNRELATEYHGLVLELGLAAVAEARAADIGVPDAVWDVLVRMTDALAAVVDDGLRPPRQGDADDGHGLVLGGTTHRWASLLTTGAAVFGAPTRWPDRPPGDLQSGALAARCGRGPGTGPRPQSRPSHFADAGLTVLRRGGVWCRCDGGPHGFGPIAAHAHADALSIEVRCNGVEILADPGTYCYHGEPEWRRYFRSTRGHNTLELDGLDQSRSGGPFLWTRHARSRVLTARTSGETLLWQAEHDGYSGGRGAARHRRTVELDGDGLRVLDEVDARRSRTARLSHHLGPEIDVELAGTVARLRWRDGEARCSATLTLPPALAWTLHRGESDPPLGWYSPGFGRRRPAYTLVGTGAVGPGTGSLRTVLAFDRGSTVEGS